MCVGELDGAADGEIVGPFVGLLLGEREGFKVGEIDGMSVGAALGSVGELDGAADGVNVGIVGLSDGDTEGSLVGALVNEQTLIVSVIRLNVVSLGMVVGDMVGITDGIFGGYPVNGASNCR